MQAWNNVKVINQDSLRAGRAGQVVRVESRGDDALIYVELDEQGTPGQEGYLPKVLDTFVATELVLL